MSQSAHDPSAPLPGPAAPPQWAPPGEYAATTPSFPPPASPAASYPATPPQPPKKKRRTWLVVLIVILAVVVVAVAALAVRVFVVAHRGTEYCQTYIQLSGQMDEISGELDQAAAKGDADAIGVGLDKMIAAFQQLQTADPPEGAGPALDSFVSTFTEVRQSLATDGLEGFVSAYTASGPQIADLAQQIDDISVDYCS